MKLNTSSFLLSILLLLIIPTQAQLSVLPKRIDFGTITAETDRVVDILVSNSGGQRDFLLRATFSHEFDVRYTSKTLDADSNLTIRIKFNPRKKGKFQEVVELWFSSANQPLLLPITADVQYVNVNENNPCPDFSQRAAECCSQNLFLVTVIDKTSKDPIPQAKVRLEEQGYVQFSLFTNKEGKVSQEVPIGFYELIAEKKGYHKNGLLGYINKRNNRFVIELERNAEWKEIETPTPPTVVVEKKDTLLSSVPEEKNTTLLDPALKSNNVVFLLDVSSSMAQADKLELLKTALSELTRVLRPQDQLTLISYAGEAKTILPTTTGDQKELLERIIAELKANGVTSGSKGFTKAYAALKSAQIEGGNNQLIVITDGAFKVEDELKIEKQVKKATRKTFTTSVVAIKSNSHAKEKLQALSSFGNGSFLLIESEEDAKETLIEELKKQAAK
jgi:Ca-activated chloride channel homolog